MIAPSSGLDSSDPDYLVAANGDHIAYVARQVSSTRPGVIFCGGLMSDMTGSKALRLEQHCRRRGLTFVRFDYHGHGRSSGAFADGTISRWTESALAVLDRLTQGPQLVVGSSMGSWIALRLILLRPHRIAGMIGLAAAPDFTERLWTTLPPQARRAVETRGYVEIASDYGDVPYRFTRALFVDGRACRVLDRLDSVRCPVRLIHGLADAEVPWQTALALARALAHTDVDLTLVPGGDHRLSAPHDLDRLVRAVDGLAAQGEGH